MQTEDISYFDKYLLNFPLLKILSAAIPSSLPSLSPNPRYRPQHSSHLFPFSFLNSFVYLLFNFFQTHPFSQGRSLTTCPWMSVG